VRLVVNGEIRDLPANLSLQQLIERLTLGPERVALELNGKVIPRALWASTLLNEDDRVEIVHFVGGGSEDCELRISDLNRPLIRGHQGMKGSFR
jgi:sulfur carrier protein